jgi:glycolate oxidase
MIIDNVISREKQVADALTGICGSRYVFTGADDLYGYGKDQTLDLDLPFDILVKPGSVEEIAAILEVCNRHRVPVTPRAGGSGVTGGALPVKRGVVLSVERLNRIIEMNETDGYIIVESGVVTADMCRHAEDRGLYFPVAPSSAGYSMVGGNVAENAGSINSCRYGTTSQYVMNLEVVLPTGEVIWTGANVSKNATGFNLTQLFVGSEGVLGIITKVVYRLVPKPTHEVSLLAGFASLEDACNAITAIRRSALQPSAVELVCQNALRMTSAWLNEPLPLVEEGINTHLLVSLQDFTEEGLMHSMELAGSILEQYTAWNILTATTAQEKEKMWKLRFSIGSALMSEGRKYRDIDIAVPLSSLYRYIRKVEEIAASHGMPLACFGHALDGNLHTMLVLNENTGIGETENAARAVNEIYSYAIKNGGVISGEHGIGLLQKEFMPMQFSGPHLQLMQQIKQLLDPNGILNPGKVL